ncbi:hypothetical protein O568_02673, partial [Staphylococcus aureus M0505]
KVVNSNTLTSDTKAISKNAKDLLIGIEKIQETY